MIALAVFGIIAAALAAAVTAGRRLLRGDDYWYLPRLVPVELRHPLTDEERADWTVRMVGRWPVRWGAGAGTEAPSPVAEPRPHPQDAPTRDRPWEYDTGQWPAVVMNLASEDVTFPGKNEPSGLDTWEW